jgi:hypothetical protein
MVKTLQARTRSFAPQPRSLGSFSNLQNRGRSARIADLINLSDGSVEPPNRFDPAVVQ